MMGVMNSWQARQQFALSSIPVGEWRSRVRALPTSDPASARKLMVLLSQHDDELMMATRDYANDTYWVSYLDSNRKKNIGLECPVGYAISAEWRDVFYALRGEIIESVEATERLCILCSNALQCSLNGYIWEKNPRKWEKPPYWTPLAGS